MAERLDQQLAVAAAKVVPAELSAEQRRRYRSLPAMIMSSGLAATGAFLLSRKETAYSEAATALLDDAAKHARIKRGDTATATLENIAAETGHRYTIAEARARMFAVWLARIASARPEKTVATEQADGDDADRVEVPVT